MLVITDQETFRVCGKSCFTCSGKSEEDSGVFTVKVCVGGAVHSCDTFQWQEVVHHREHTFLHFSTVPCVNDNLFFGCNVEHYSCLRVQTKFFVVFNFCFGSIVYNEIWLKCFKLFSCWLDEHVCNKMCLPSNFNDETDSHTSISVSTAECVNYEKFLIGKFFFCNFFTSVPSFLCCRMVVVLVFIRSPPNCIFGVLIHNDEFIFRRTSCIDTCHNVNSAKFCFLSYFEAFKTCFSLFLE